MATQPSILWPQVHVVSMCQVRRLLPSACLELQPSLWVDLILVKIPYFLMFPAITQRHEQHHC